MARKYNIEEMSTELVMTALSAALRCIEDQYVSFLSILELKNSLTSVEERVSPKGEPRSFETSPAEAYCQGKACVQAGVGRPFGCQ
jgi:hypothetical protein